MVSTQPTIEGIVDYGEVVLEPGLIEDGKLVDAQAFQVQLEKLVKNKKWRKASLSFCVPDSSVTIREHLVPKGLAKEEIKAFIHMEIEESIRLPFSDPVVDFTIVGEENDQTKILLFAYPKKRIAELIQSFEKVGLKPKVADLSSLSLYRLYFQLDLAKQKEHLLLVQWGKDATVLTAFNYNKPIFTRYMKSTYNRNNWTWSDRESELIWSGDEEDIDQMIEDQMVSLERFMDFYQYSVMEGDEQINKVLLVGDFPYMPRVERVMQERIPVAIESFKNMEEKLHHPSKFADVIGLVIKSNKKK